MNAQTVVPIILQLFGAAGGNAEAIAGLLARGGAAIAALRGATTNTERGTAIDQLLPLLKEAGGMLGVDRGLSDEEITASLREIDAADSKFDTKYDFTPGGSKT